MSDYTQSTFFAPKDALSSGDPLKIIYGAEVDPELSAISTAIATKYDSTDLASQAVAEAGTSNVTLMTPLRTEQWSAVWAAENAGIVGDLQALADPNADRVVGWDDSAGAAVFFTPTEGIQMNATDLKLNVNGLTADGTPDTAADYVVTYDASAGTHKKVLLDNLPGGGTPAQSVTTKALTDDYDFSNTGTYTEVTALTQTVEANETYLYEAFYHVTVTTSGHAAQIQFDPNGVYEGTWWIIDSITASSPFAYATGGAGDQVGFGSTSAGSGRDETYLMVLALRPTAAGNIEFQIKQATSDANQAEIEPGAYTRLTKLS